MSNRSILELKIENIKNTNYGLYQLTKEYKIKPYNYQLENINWCKNLEKTLNKEESINLMYGYDDKIRIDNYYLMNNNVLYLHGKVIVQPEDSKSLKYFFHAQGGLLCDNTGLGKTLTLTIHVTDDSTKINELCMERANMLIDYKERINNLMQLEDPSQEEILIHKLEIMQAIDNEYKMLFDNYKLKTNCNLLIVPVRLLQQWETEIKSYISTNKIYLINTVRDFYKLKLENIENYTVIIISVTFLQNDKRFLHPDGYDITHILWKRIIVDEIHELYTTVILGHNSIIFNKLLECKHFIYRWGLTATPFIDHSSMFNIIKYLLGTNKIYNPNVGNHIMIQNQFKRVFRKNTKLNVEYELKLPEVEINNILFQLKRI
jgi:hypothetical protein